MTEKPIPPETLPNYVVEPLERQDTETLRDVQEFVAELIEHREREVTEEDLPEEAEPVEADEDGGRGTLVKERVTCGDESCACMSGGEKHGPYLYRYFREGDSLTSEYVGKPE